MQTVDQHDYLWNLPKFEQKIKRQKAQEDLDCVGLLFVDYLWFRYEDIQEWTQFTDVVQRITALE